MQETIAQSVHTTSMVGRTGLGASVATAASGSGDDVSVQGVRALHCSNGISSEVIGVVYNICIRISQHKLSVFI